MKKIKIFTNHYYPENFKINELTLELLKEFEIDVLTQVPNYSKSSFYPGYSRFKRNAELVEGVTVKRLPVIPRSTNNTGLFLNYISYIISSLIYSCFTRDESDHVFVYLTSPIFISWPHSDLQRKTKSKALYIY